MKHFPFLFFFFLIMKYSLKASVIIRLCLSLKMIMLFTGVTMSTFSILIGLKCYFEFSSDAVL